MPNPEAAGTRPARAYPTEGPSWLTLVAALAAAGQRLATGSSAFRHLRTKQAIRFVQVAFGYWEISIGHVGGGIQINYSFFILEEPGVEFYS